MKETKYLAVDFGLKRIGVAVSDFSKSYAFSRGYILNNKSAFIKLLKLINEESVEKIIIGYPEAYDNLKAHSTLHIKKFKVDIENFLKINSVKCLCEFFDERFTSSIAQYHISRSGISASGRKDKGNIDALSAQILLQDYLDKEKNTLR